MIDHVIGGSQLVILLGIFLRLGALTQRQADHEREDNRRFSFLEKGFSTCPSPKSSPS